MRDKGRVEAGVKFVQGSFFAGERFMDIADAQRRADDWCRVRAGMRVHGTTRQRPADKSRVQLPRTRGPERPVEREDPSVPATDPWVRRNSGQSTAPRRTRALAALCDQLSQAASRYPGTDLVLHYEVKPHPGIT